MPFRKDSSSDRPPSYFKIDARSPLQQRVRPPRQFRLYRADTGRPLRRFARIPAACGTVPAPRSVPPGPGRHGSAPGAVPVPGKRPPESRWFPRPLGRSLSPGPRTWTARANAVTSPSYPCRSPLPRSVVSNRKPSSFPAFAPPSRTNALPLGRQRLQLPGRAVVKGKRPCPLPGRPRLSRPGQRVRTRLSLVSLARSRAGPGRQRAPPAVSSGRHGPGGSQLAPPPRPIFAPASVFAAMLGCLQGQALVDAPLSFLNGRRPGPVPFVDSGASCGPFPLGGDPRGSANRARRAGRSAIPVESGPGRRRVRPIRSPSRSRFRDRRQANLWSQ